ncbi:MAG: SDR family NAD(P)-dependent oxidoreductase [Endozoicomonadaceae bacterium]|nr:SDR family NAD(P)-dependent oxidoreductase [Endozoicomonadaceae bacterium]
MSNLKCQVAVVTGAAGGIGYEIVKRLLHEQYYVALLDQQANQLDQMIDQFAQFKSQIKSYVIDVTNEVQVTETMQNIKDTWGRFDILINNAGILKDNILIKTNAAHEITHKLSLAEFQSVLNVNLTGVFLCGREAAVQMIQCLQGGVIINMSSLVRSGNFGQSSYAASKAGVAALTKTWAQELARWDIRVAGIAPGVIQTVMTENMKPIALDMLCKKVPVGRLGLPVEVADAIDFILKNKYFNARILELDGGLSL